MTTAEPPPRIITLRLTPAELGIISEALAAEAARFHDDWIVDHATRSPFYNPGDAWRTLAPLHRLHRKVRAAS